jgi:hypothetical protein
VRWRLSKKPQDGSSLIKEDSHIQGLLMKKLHFAIFLIFIISSISQTNAASPPFQTVSIKKNHKILSPYFIENKGQTNPKVKFYLKNGSQTFYFTREGIIFDFIHEKASNNKAGQLERQIFSLKFIDASPNINIDGYDKKTTKINLIKGKNRNEWYTNIPTWGGIIYKELYKGIDLKLYCKNNKLKYEFIIEPEADPAQIKLAYTGVKNLTVNDKGELVIYTEIGTLKESKPYIYQIDHQLF